MTNYRPISLLMVFSKVLEKAMHSRLSQHLHMNNVLVTEQYSFRKGTLTDDPDSALKCTNKKMQGAGISCDLSMPFDCVTYAILLAILHFYGILGVYEDWFRS